MPEYIKVQLIPPRLVFFLLNGQRSSLTWPDTSQFIPHLIELSAQGKLPFDRIVKQYKQDQLEEAFHDLHSGTVVKPVIVFD